MANITVSDCSIRVTALLEYFDLYYSIKEMLGGRKEGWGEGGGHVPPGSTLAVWHIKYSMF